MQKNPAGGSPSPSTSITSSTPDPSSTFMSAALTMSWELLLAVLVPVIGGSQLDKSFGTKHLYTFIGLGLAVLGSAVVMRHTVRLVNRFPVPTLSAAQRRAIKKQYDDEDDN